MLVTLFSSGWLGVGGQHPLLSHLPFNSVQPQFKTKFASFVQRRYVEIYISSSCESLVSTKLVLAEACKHNTALLTL